MENLCNRIRNIYPQLKRKDFNPFLGGTIYLQNDGDGTYIREWNHPELSKPTEEQLLASSEEPVSDALTPEEKLAAAGLTVEELKSLLNL